MGLTSGMSLLIFLPRPIIPTVWVGYKGAASKLERMRLIGQEKRLIVFAHDTSARTADHFDSTAIVVTALRSLRYRLDGWANGLGRKPRDKSIAANLRSYFEHELCHAPGMIRFSTDVNASSNDV